MRTCKELNINEELQRNILRKYQDTPNIAILSSKNPKSIAGALIYLITKQNGTKATQEDIARQLNTTGVSIRNTIHTIFSRTELKKWMEK